MHFVGFFLSQKEKLSLEILLKNIESISLDPELVL